MSNVEIIVHGIPTLCDDVPSLRGLYNDRDSVSYLGEYSVKASADNNSAGNDNGMPPLVCSDNGDDTTDAIQDSVDWECHKRPDAASDTSEGSSLMLCCTQW